MLEPILGRTGPTIGASNAKNALEADFEVKTRLALPKLAQKDQKQSPTRKNFAETKIFRQKLICRESSETRFGKVSQRLERKNVISITK